MTESEKPGVAPTRPNVLPLSRAPPGRAGGAGAGLQLPLQLTLGLGHSATRDCFQKQERGEKAEAAGVGRRAWPSKLVLELFAVHMPICFVIAWLFLEATGVSRKPESVDCVSSVWGV